MSKILEPIIGRIKAAGSCPVTDYIDKSTMYEEGHEPMAEPERTDELEKHVNESIQLRLREDLNPNKAGVKPKSHTVLFGSRLDTKKNITTHKAVYTFNRGGSIGLPANIATSILWTPEHGSWIEEVDPEEVPKVEG
jgi:hypothetical protein